jgi:hypothetical protein
MNIFNNVIFGCRITNANILDCQIANSTGRETSLLKVSKVINCGSTISNCSYNEEPEPCQDCKPHSWELRKSEFNRLKNTFLCD